MCELLQWMLVQHVLCVRPDSLEVVAQKPLALALAGTEATSVHMFNNNAYA